ncbi:MAG: polyprenyl synthetase family protein [Robiginitomaculum sp.]|nr:polyprenyl synthetase family protein [Robiginitomaculum sp.]
MGIPLKKTDQKQPIEQLASLVENGMSQVNDLIAERMQSPIGMIPDLAAHLVDAGGKRLRPMITLATSQMLGVSGDNPIKLATAVEFIHSATLLHDDIVDGSELRRGKTAANRLWGNSASILVGDFLFARSFSLMVETGHIGVLGILSKASAVIAEGEVHQLAVIGNVDLPIKEYMQIIEAKTAELFAAAASVSAVIANSTEQQQQALDKFGRSLGLAFQLIDDTLDYNGHDDVLGKHTGDDFREGKLTLPLLLAYRQADTNTQKWWQQILSADTRNDDDLAKATRLINQSGALEEALSQARKFALQAQTSLEIFSDSSIRNCLMELCDFLVQRRS